MDNPEAMERVTLAANHAFHAADDIESYAQQLEELASIAIVHGFTTDQLQKMKLRAQQIRIAYDDVSNALSEIDIYLGGI